MAKYTVKHEPLPESGDVSKETLLNTYKHVLRGKKPKIVDKHVRELVGMVPVKNTEVVYSDKQKMNMKLERRIYLLVKSRVAMGDCDDKTIVDYVTRAVINRLVDEGFVK
jgi:Icc-related predicted phosphoesterase